MITLNARNNPVYTTLWLPILVGLLLVGSGCNKKTASPPPAVRPAVIKPKIIVQKPVSSVSIAPAKMNQFDFSARKDPFKPYISVKAVASGRAVKPVLPIHSFDVTQFRLIGTVTDPKGNKAMVVDPAGKGYVLKVGMTIGKNEGKIVRIDTTGVDVVEQFKEDNSKIRKEITRIPLLRKP